MQYIINKLKITNIKVHCEPGLMFDTNAQIGIPLLWPRPHPSNPVAQKQSKTSSGQKVLHHQGLYMLKQGLVYADPHQVVSNEDVIVPLHVCICDIIWMTLVDHEPPHDVVVRFALYVQSCHLVLCTEPLNKKRHRINRKTKN